MDIEYSRSGSEPAIDTLKISAGEYAKLTDSLQAEADRFNGSNGRGDVRFPYAPTNLTMRVLHPGGTYNNFVVRSRNLSNGGIGVFHGGFLHEGTQVEVNLQTDDGETMATVGHVSHCRLVGGRVHELGIRFDRKIDVSNFLEEGNGHETTYQIGGKVVCFEETDAEGQLLQFQLAELGTKVQIVKSVEECTQALGEGDVDITLLGDGLPDTTGLQFAKKIIEAGYKTNIALISDNDSEVFKKDALAVGCKDVIKKPYDIEHIGDVVRQSVKPKSSVLDNDQLMSAFWGNNKIRPLIVKYLDTLQEWVVGINAAFHDNNQSELRRRLREIKGSAGNYGFPTISMTAGRIDKMLDEGAEPEKIEVSIMELDQSARGAWAVASTSAAA